MQKSQTFGTFKYTLCDKIVLGFAKKLNNMICYPFPGNMLMEHDGLPFS